ncbi:hypothetical protein BCV71DRAFT_271761 [Rhizopus microsporus]|uniref:Uncharacterized protein n=1 Tax=Rhizopus microsporus TaxID=58291 RepID=A0A1X0RWM6_RHIZD|nr:hypothetical protein BCV71DRAFT_271761 [Rhizopus microsporus]
MVIYDGISKRTWFNVVHDVFVVNAFPLQKRKELQQKVIRKYAAYGGEIDKDRTKNDSVSQILYSFYSPFSLVWMLFSTAAVLHACKSAEKAEIGNKAIIDIVKDCKERDANLLTEFANVPWP